MSLGPTILAVGTTAKESLPNAIAKATASQNWIFGLYIASLVFAAVMTLLAWKAGNRLQDSIRADANARITEASATAATAKEHAAQADAKAATANAEAARANDSAAAANERAQRLEHDNLHLRTDLEAATAESRAKQAELAREQTKLAAEQRKTAEAQRATAEAQLALKKYAEQVEERRKPRHLSGEQRTRFVSTLHSAPEKAAVNIICGDAEACAFAKQLSIALREADWQDVRGGDGDVQTVLKPIGHLPPAEGRRVYLTSASSPDGGLSAAGFDFSAEADPNLEVGLLGIIIGVKP
ncbi:MAG TPA: hypothetical protein VN923_13845 [Thermoanaerobaculia bacterium]|nr:hypothetical protein [Thermoanaerobaculia bacterium]